MSDLIRALVVAGLMSGTQPITIMGLLLLRTGQHGTRNSWAFLCGAFSVETAFLLLASFVVGDSVEGDSAPGRGLLIIRVVLGIALIITGFRLRKPAKKEQPEVPKALQRLRDLTPFKSFVAGVLLADYVGPIIASLAIASADVGLGGRLTAMIFYTLLATGIPATFLILSNRRKTTEEKLSRLINWVMAHRRRLSSWFALILGVFLVADATIGLIVVQAA